MKKELLAPAGDIEAGYAALYYGADAVYLGLKHFSARATATNFDENELNEFVGFAHARGKKVFAAINTLVQENELPELMDSLNICARCRIDAVILQDLGVAKIIKECYPQLELHASTQMAVHNKAGALALQKLGFSRVVLARELNLNEIKEIAAIPGLETEAFVHGALCYSYSGMCLFSSLEYGRSANRGKCLYPCRSEFEDDNGARHCFSMKDMALKDDVLKMPVTSLKIEGRKKSALYVAAVTDYYRNILDGKGANAAKEENIKQIFSRPWSKFHLHGKDKTVIEPDFVGHRGLPIGKIEQVFTGRITLHVRRDIARHDGIQIDIPGEERPFGFSLQSMQVGGKSVFEAKENDEVVIYLPNKPPRLEKGYAVYLASSSRVKGSYDYTKPKPGEFKQREAVAVKVEITADKVRATSASFVSEINGEFTPARDAAKVDEAVKGAFVKTGDTEFCLDKIEVVNPDGRFVPVSMLNELRRDLYAQIVPEKIEHQLPDAGVPHSVEQPGWIIRSDDINLLSGMDLSAADEVVLVLNQGLDVDKLKELPKNKLRLALPALCRNTKPFAEMTNSLLAVGYKKWEIGNWWGLDLLPERGIDLSFDSSLYMLNTQAIAAAKEAGAARITLSVEDCLDNMKQLVSKSTLPVVMPVYQDAPLFSSAVCIRANACNVCPKGDKWLKLRYDGKEYNALSKDCQMVVLADKPLCFAEEAKSVAAAFYRVDFMYRRYRAESANVIWDKLRSFQDVAGTNKISKGNLKRGI